MHCKCKSKKEHWLYRCFYKVTPFLIQEITWKMKPNTDISQLISMTSIFQKYEEIQEEPSHSKRCNVLFIQFEHLSPACRSLQHWTEAGNAALGTHWPSCILHTSQTEATLTDLPAAPIPNKVCHSHLSHRPEINFLFLTSIIYTVCLACLTEVRDQSKNHHDCASLAPVQDFTQYAL